MKNYFQSLDGGSVVPFFQVIKVEKYDDSKKFITVHYPNQYGDVISCPVSQLEEYYDWLENARFVRIVNE